MKFVLMKIYLFLKSGYSMLLKKNDLNRIQAIYAIYYVHDYL